jgi:type I restriction enzyme S subunit
MKPGYKQTEVGVIPEEWDVVALGSLTTTVASGKSRSGGGQGTYPVHGSTGIIGYTERPEYEGDSILAARVGANAGKLNLVSGKYGVTDNTIMLRLRGGYSLPFFWRQLETKRLNSLVFGSGQPLITGSQLKALSLTVPPLPEQRAIATALSDVDGLLGGLDRLIAKKRDLKQAAMQQLLTGQTRLPGWDGAWEVKRLGDVAEMGSGGTPTSSVPAYYDGDIPWASISDMTKGGKVISSTDRNLTRAGFTNSAAQMFPAGTILYAMYASLGECSIAGISLCSSQAILGIRPKDKLNGEFLYYFLTSLKVIVKTLGQQGTQANLNKGMVQDFRLSLPPLPEQTAIAKVLTEMDGELAVLEQRREKTRALKQAMMQELLTGRTRLV